MAHLKRDDFTDTLPFKAYYLSQLKWVAEFYEEILLLHYKHFFLSGFMAYYESISFSRVTLSLTRPRL